MANVRQASFEDIGKLKALMSRHDLELGNRGVKELHHLWKNNPVFQNSGNSWPLGWVIENDAGQIVGFHGNIPMAYEFKSQRLTVAIASSWAVDKEYRQYSFLLLDSYFRQNAADFLITTTANEISEKAWLAFEGRRVPMDSLDTIFFWIINHRRFIRSALIKKGLPAGYAVNVPISTVLKGMEIMRIRNTWPAKLRSEIQSLPGFDERFDVFWEKLRNRQDRLLCVRDRRWLNWHFAYALSHNKAWIYAAIRESSIRSYAVFVRGDNPKIGLTRVKLVDFQSIEEDPNALESILCAAVRRCKEQGIDVVEIAGFGPQERNVIKRFAPYRRKLNCWPFLYKATNEALAEELANKDVWLTCLFDGDASL